MTPETIEKLFTRETAEKRIATLPTDYRKMIDGCLAELTPKLPQGRHPEFYLGLVHGVMMGGTLADPLDVSSIGDALLIHWLEVEPGAADER